MNTSQALEMINALADGIDPVTGEEMADASPYQHPQVVSALYVAVRQLESALRREKIKSTLPANAGLSWTDDEDRKLIEKFKAGMSVEDLVKSHQRTYGAIRTRLVQHGLLEPQYPTEAITAIKGR